MNETAAKQDRQGEPSSQSVSTTEGRGSRDPNRALTLLPWVDVFENDDSIQLFVDMPGVPKDKLELRVENDSLQIEGEIAPDTPENIEAIYAEVRAPRYSRAFSLSAELDTANIDAQLRDGVLQLRIPKHAHAQPRKIEVKVA